MIEQYTAYKPTKWERRIDSLFGLVSPKSQLTRMVDREKINWFRYLGAYPSGARQNAMPSTAGEWIRIQREKMQVMWNAIDMVDNSGLCSGILIKFPTYVCGTLRWQAKTGDKSINTMYQEYIAHKTNKPGNIDIKRMHSLRTMCMLDVRSIALKGDVGTNIVREDDELYLQGIEANRIGDPYKWITSDTYVRGLIIDKRTGAIDAARVYHQDRRDGLYKFDDTFKMRDERGLPKFLFFTNPLSFDDYRGVSLFKHAIDNATYIDRMRSYELQALLWAASMSGVYYTKSGALPEQLPFSRTPVQDRDGNMIDTFEARPNTIVSLSSEGEKVEMFQHLRPSPNVIGMYENTVREIAIGAGLTYGFAYDMTGVTGPAVRQCSAQDARAISIWQEMLREQKLDPVIMLLLGDAIAKGDLPYHPKWLKWDWFFPAKPTIDVGRESSANIEEINAGINTGARIAADSGDGDIEEIITQRSHEVEMAIEAAQKIAEKQGIQWQEVYALMIPPPRGSGRAGMAASANMAAGMANQNPDQPGATDNGVDLDGDDGENGDGTNEFRLKKKEDSCFVIETDDSIIEFYNPAQIRDEGGRFGDEGKGAGQPGYKHPGQAGLKGTDKKLVDIVPHRPLTRANKDVKGIRDYVPGMHYVNYTKTPFFNKLNELQGTPEPTKISPAEFSAARKALFNEKGVKEKLKIKDLIATQPVVNSEKVGRNVAEGKSKRIFVVRYGGRDFIMDGHHALAAAAARGDVKIKARVLSISNAPKIAQEFDAESGKTQARDQGGKWSDEGKGSDQPGYKHPSDQSAVAGPSRQIEDHKSMAREPLGATTKAQTPITKGQARGNAREVSKTLYDIHRERGKAYLKALEDQPQEAWGLDKNWEGVKAHAYEETRKQWGGVTIDPVTGEDYKPPARASGPYAISVKSPGQPGISIPINASQDQFNSAMDLARQSYARQLGAKSHYLGVFTDNDKGTIDIDPVAIVDTPEQVEAIGAYTKSIGGAYDFATGNGYFPPYIKGNSTTRNPERTSVKQVLGTRGITEVEEDEARGLSHTSEVKFVTFDNGKKGVFKPASGASSAGRDWIEGNLVEREVAAGEVAELLGLDDLVPASVIRDVDGEEGSMQEMVDGQTARRTSLDIFDGQDDLARAAAFDYLIWNTDRHDNNWIVKPDGKLALIDNGLSFPTREGGFANHSLYDEAQSRGLDVPEEVRDEWVSQWPNIKTVLKSHGMDDEAIEGVEKRLNVDLANSGSFRDLPDWEEGNRNYDREPSEPNDGDLSLTDEEEESTGTPMAVGGSRGTLETSKGSYPHGGRYPKSSELTGPNPSVRASEWVDHRGGIHERKQHRGRIAAGGDQREQGEVDYDKFLHYHHSLKAVMDESGGWTYQHSHPLGDLNPKLPGLETGNSSDWKPQPKEESSGRATSTGERQKVVDEIKEIQARNAKNLQPLVHQSEIVDEKGVIHKKVDVNMADSANWDDMNEVGKAEVRARMAEQRKKRGIDV